MIEKAVPELRDGKLLASDFTYPPPMAIVRAIVGGILILRLALREVHLPETAYLAD